MVLEHIRDSADEDCIVVSGVGQHQMWTSQRWKFNHPYTWVNSGGPGTMGFAVPAAIGAKVGKPDRCVWAIDGDGCFQMTAQELVTASAERIPIKVAILNNAYLGMVRQWQELFYKERYSEVYLSPDLPDYVKWAEAMGCVGLRVENPEDVAPTIEKANAVDDRPVVIDFRVDYREKVYPMVATVRADASNRGQVTELAAIFEARILDVGPEALTVMAAGTPEKIDSIEELLRPFGITGLQRTGRIALPKIPRGTVRLAAVPE